MSRFYLTTAIDFVNNRPHLGTAYEKVCADVVARYKRLCGVDTRFLMGNDEHSQNVFRSAADRGLDPLTYCDQMEQEFTSTWRHLHISFDDFIRTTSDRHKAGVTAFAQRMHDAGDIYEGTYEGWYCVGCEAFKQEKDLVGGKCPLHPTTPLQWLNEKNYFFRLSKYRDALAEQFRGEAGFLQPDARRHEILRLLESGLEDISISRAGQAWGIPLPFDPSSVVYVWVDALINYASAVGLGYDEVMFERWWPADLHIVGKDITRFHTVIWPAMLMSAGLPLPKRVFGHGFMTLSGQRMSKSLGTIVDPIEAANRHGVDPLRLYLVKEIVFGADGDFTWARYDERYNADLANNLGNLVSRVSAMAARYRGGRLEPSALGPGALARVADAVLARYRSAMEQLSIHEGAAAAFLLVDSANEFITETAPWALANSPVNAARLDQVLFDAVEAIRLASVMLSPIMPSSCGQIFRRLGVGADALSLAEDGRWRASGERIVSVEGPLWPRDDTARPEGAKSPASDRGARRVTRAPEQVSRKEQKVNESTGSSPAPGQTAEPAAADGRISIEDFLKVELRVAKVIAAERVPKSKRLLKLSVDLGHEQRTVVAGIAEAYEPETILGRTVVVVFNLQPAKLMGIESNGMVLAASPDDGKPVLVGFEQAPAPGTRVR